MCTICFNIKKLCLLSRSVRVFISSIWFSKYIPFSVNVIYLLVSIMDKVLVLCEAGFRWTSVVCIACDLLINEFLEKLHELCSSAVFVYLLLVSFFFFCVTTKSPSDEWRLDICITCFSRNAVLEIVTLLNAEMFPCEPQTIGLTGYKHVAEFQELTMNVSLKSQVANSSHNPGQF